MNEHFLLSSTINSLKDYHRSRGDALTKALSMKPKEILSLIEESGLRGRGGAGFPAGKKWRTLLNDYSAKKYVVVNAAEGEPGTFKDRMVIRKCPYAVIEGALIAAHFLDQNEIYIALKKSFTKEIQRIIDALEEFQHSGLLKHIKVHIVSGPEDYLFGEEKALLNVIEGIGPFPREPHQPPYEIGLFATTTSRNPALMSNVETYARVPAIILYGAESFRAIGTEDTTGPLICTLYGDVKHQGIYEITPGITMEELLYKFGGGPARGLGFKAILSGVSNPVLTSEHLDARIEFKNLSEKGGGLGSAGFMIYDEGRSIPRLTQEVAKFLYRESCNQCTSCKSGLGNASISIDALFVDNKDPNLFLTAIREARRAPTANRCFLPVEGSLIIPDLLMTFREEFEQCHTPFHLLKREVLPLIRDFDETTGKFILKDDPLLEDRPYFQDWDPKSFTMIDRGSF